MQPDQIIKGRTYRGAPPDDDHTIHVEDEDGDKVRIRRYRGERLLSTAWMDRGALALWAEADVTPGALVPVEIEIKPLDLVVGIDPAGPDGDGAVCLAARADDGQLMILGLEVV